MPNVSDTHDLVWLYWDDKTDAFMTSRIPICRVVATIEEARKGGLGLC